MIEFSIYSSNGVGRDATWSFNSGGGRKSDCEDVTESKRDRKKSPIAVPAWHRNIKVPVPTVSLSVCDGVVEARAAETVASEAKAMAKVECQDRVAVTCRFV